MSNKKIIFNKLRAMSGGRLNQNQVVAGDFIIDMVGTSKVMDFLDIDDGTYILNAKKLKNIHSGADTDFVDIINKHAPTFGITTKKRMAMFLAHAIHESNGFTRLQESFRYRPTRLKQVFGRRIPSLEFARQLINKGQAAVANHLYGGRYGNNKINDGWLYSGKGIGGLTFKNNYIRMQKVLSDMGLDFDIVKNPHLLKDKEIATLTFMAYWQDRNLNSYSDAGDVRGATKVINGGYNGYKDRLKYYNRAMKYL